MRMWPGVPYVPPHVASPREYGYTLPTEETLRKREVCLQDTQDTLGRIREVSPGGPPHHDIVQVGKGVGEGIA